MIFRSALKNIPDKILQLHLNQSPGVYYHRQYAVLWTKTVKSVAPVKLEENIEFERCRNTGSIVFGHHFTSACGNDENPLCFELPLKEIKSKGAVKK